MKTTVVRTVIFLVVVIFLNINSYSYTNDKIEDFGAMSLKINLEKLFKVELEKEEIFLGKDFLIKADRNGEVYILDYKSCKIFIFSQDGSYKTSIGKKGEGPGELINPATLMFSDSEIWIFEHYFPIAHIYNKETKKFIKKKKLPSYKNRTFYRSDFLSKNKKVLYGLINLDPKFNSFISFYISDPEFKKSLSLYNTTKYELFNTEMLGISYCCSQDGYIFIAPRSKKKYKIQVYNSEGKFVKEIKKQDYVSIKKSVNELKQQEEKAIQRKKKGLTKRPSHSLKTSIQQMACDYKERIWVLTPSKNSEDKFLNIDIFNTKGLLINTIELKEFIKPELFMSGKNLFILEKDDSKDNGRFFIKYRIVEPKE